MKTLTLAILILFCSTVARAQITPHAALDFRGSDRIRIVETSLLAGALAADHYETRALLDRGGHESDPIFGEHPSIARQVGIGTLELAGVSAGFALIERSPRPWVRWTGRLAVAGLTIAHVSAAVHDANQPGMRKGPVIPGRVR